MDAVMEGLQLGLSLGILAGVFFGWIACRAFDAVMER
jgi:hypothetical protein